MPTLANRHSSAVRSSESKQGTGGKIFGGWGGGELGGGEGLAIRTCFFQLVPFRTLFTWNLTFGVAGLVHVPLKGIPKRQVL